MANLAALCVAFLILVVGKVQGRFLRLNSSELLVSDGVDHVDYQPPFISLNGMFSSSETCEHYYGFFPCADNIGGYLFQIVVYNYLLASGEKFLTMGSKQLFNIIGTGFFGDVFEILMVLPEIMVSLKSYLEILHGIRAVFENLRLRSVFANPSTIASLSRRCRRFSVIVASLSRHFVRQHLQSTSFSLPFIPSALQLADFFTKTHTTARFQFLLNKFYMFYAKTP